MPLYSVFVYRFTTRAVCVWRKIMNCDWMEIPIEEIHLFLFFFFFRIKMFCTDTKISWKWNERARVNNSLHEHKTHNCNGFLLFLAVHRVNWHILCCRRERERERAGREKPFERRILFGSIVLSFSYYYLSSRQQSATRMQPINFDNKTKTTKVKHFELSFTLTLSPGHCLPLEVK